MPNINTEQITINSRNASNTRPVNKSITGIFFNNVNAYETTPFINAKIYGESTGRALSPTEMHQLRDKIKQIIELFDQTIINSNLFGEDLELAKIIFIYNYILQNVQYADVIPANDGTSRVQNRNDDLLTPYESAYSCLVLKKSICCGISDAIYLLCLVMNLECEKWLWPDGGHAYNKVKIGNTWYKVDATFQIGFYPHAQAENWNDTHLLTATTNHEQISPTTMYPRQQIERIKTFLQNRGINFNYNRAPKIQIRTTKEGLQALIKDPSKSEEEQKNSFQNLQNIITSVDSVLSANPHITINKRTDQNSIIKDNPTIYFTPAEKKITIQKVNYKINIVSTNDSYAVNIETPDNNQHTQITNRQGKIIGILKRGLEIITSLFEPSTFDSLNTPSSILNNNQNNTTKRYR